MTEVKAQCSRCKKEWPAPYNFVIINGRCPWCPRDPVEDAIEKYQREHCPTCGQKLTGANP